MTRCWTAARISMMGKTRERKNKAIATMIRPLSWTIIARRIWTIARHSSLQTPRANSASSTSLTPAFLALRFLARVFRWWFGQDADRFAAYWLQIRDRSCDRRDVLRIRSTTSADQAGPFRHHLSRCPGKIIWRRMIYETALVIF